MAKQSVLHSTLQNHGPMAAFTILTLCGAGFIVTAKLWGLNTLVVTGVPIAIMLAYLVISLLAEGLRLHNEQAGDNLYYMGFLFTLTSLGVSLYRFADETSIDQIVQNFGIAVSSTICGIALRIFFNQMRRDPIDIERSVRHELAEMTRRVRTELDSSAREFSGYRRTSSQMLVEGFEEIARQAEQTGAAVQRAIETLSKESIKPIQEASEKLATISEQNLTLFEQRSAKLNELAEEASQKLTQTSSQISDLIEKFSSAIEAISEKTEQMKLPDEILRIELKPAIEAIRESGELQKRLAEEGAAHLNRQATKTAETLQPLSDMPDRLTAALKPIQALPESMQETLQPVAHASKRLADSMDELNKTTQALSQVTQASRQSAMAPQRGSFADRPTGTPPPYPSHIGGVGTEPSHPAPDTPTKPVNEQTPPVQTPEHNTQSLDSADQPSTPEQASADESHTKKSWFRRW